MWESNIKFEPVNDNWLFSFIFSGLLLFTIITSTILHIAFEAPVAFVWAEIFKMIKKKLSSTKFDTGNIKMTNRDDTTGVLA